MISCFLFGYGYCRILSNMDLESDRENTIKRIKIYLFSIHIRNRRRAGLVQLVSASSPSYQVLGLKSSLYRISVGVRLCFSYSLP
jgi:hypothetical protein